MSYSNIAFSYLCYFLLTGNICFLPQSSKTWRTVFQGLQERAMWGIFYFSPRKGMAFPQEPSLWAASCQTIRGCKFPACPTAVIFPSCDLVSHVLSVLLLGHTQSWAVSTPLPTRAHLTAPASPGPGQLRKCWILKHAGAIHKPAPHGSSEQT